MSENEIHVVAGPGVFDVDAEMIAKIIHAHCPVSMASAVSAANCIIDYLVEVLSKPEKIQ
jgi:hypothetical protein